MKLRVIQLFSFQNYELSFFRKMHFLTDWWFFRIANDENSYMLTTHKKWWAINMSVKFWDKNADSWKDFWSTHDVTLDLTWLKNAHEKTFWIFSVSAPQCFLWPQLQMTCCNIARYDVREKHVRLVVIKDLCSLNSQGAQRDQIRLFFVYGLIFARPNCLSSNVLV